MDHARWMTLAIAAARRGLAAGQTPFGAAIVRAGQLVVADHNHVLATTDITAHAEVHTIRQACHLLGAIDLSGCVIYSTCEPCPMCFSACHWARLDAIVYGAAIPDAQAAGFHEMPVSNQQLKQLGQSPIQIVPGVLTAECRQLFHDWLALPGRKAY